jgi:hypothetical protein
MEKKKTEQKQYRVMLSEVWKQAVLVTAGSPEEAAIMAANGDYDEEIDGYKEYAYELDDVPELYDVYDAVTDECCAEDD